MYRPEIRATFLYHLIVPINKDKMILNTYFVFVKFVCMLNLNFIYIKLKATDFYMHTIINIFFHMKSKHSYKQFLIPL